MQEEFENFCLKIELQIQLERPTLSGRNMSVYLKYVIIQKNDIDA